MGMVVRTNMAALNANNALGQASKAQQSGMQKLASGFKINKAADDASGLAISEKMKNQIKALDTAKDNCEDGANLIQTAEGYMAETHDILNRMVELAEKSANGTLGKEDRSSLQDEMDELCSEIDRIASTANFNGHKLLDGSIGSNGYVKITSTDGEPVKYEFDTLTNQNVKITWGANVTASNTVAGSGSDTSTLGNTLQIGESSTSADKLEVKINSFHTDSLFAGIDGFKNKSNDTTNASASATARILNNYTATVGTGAGNVKGTSTYKTAVSIDISGKADTNGDLTDSQIQERASAAADAIRQVSNYVSDQRGKLGAQQNRLEHTVNNLTTASENTTAANSRIRDTDMAKEMMAYTSKNVIAQAAQSMLAQANSQPQNVLSLLQ